VILIKKLISSTEFQKVYNLMEISQVEAEVFHADGQANVQRDMTELKSLFAIL
jgi:hypothetical protein